MLLFLLLLFPLALTGYWFYKKRPELFIVMIIGFLTSAVVCAFNFFFKFSHRVVPYSFGLNFVYFMEKTGLIPVCVVYGLFLLITKNSLKNRLDYFIPLMLSYYMILIPYNVISSCESTTYPGFLIFVKPVIYLSMIYSAGYALNRFYNFIEQKKKLGAVICILIFVLLLIIPSVIEALYVINYSFSLVLIVSLVYIILPAAAGVGLYFSNYKEI